MQHTDRRNVRTMCVQAKEGVMPKGSAPERAPRDGRINLRTTTRQTRLLQQAAAATDRSITDFVLDSAVTQAERVLADRRWFILDDTKWEDFQRLLDAPVRELPKLTRLFSKPSPFVDHHEQE